MTYSAQSIRKGILMSGAIAACVFSAYTTTAGETVTPRVVEAEISKDTGQISFWVKPDWDGNDGKRHVLVCVGDPEINGMLVEKSPQNMIRFVMAGDSKASAARFAVPHWKAGEWHMVTARWNKKKDDSGTIALLLDEHLPGRGGPEPVHGVYITGKGFMDPQSMEDKRIYIGENASDTVIGELIVQTDNGDMYADYYKTAPYESISIDYAPNYARTDTRVVAGYPKQFGLRGVIRGEERQLTDFTKRYGCWGSRDAKKLISWQTSDPKVATVDKNGLVTGVAPGTCTLTAEFSGMKATYPVEVISSDRADLTIIQLSRKPLYHKNARKTDPAPGDPVTITAVIGNYGFKDSKAGVPVRFELIPDANGNFILDEDEQPIVKQSQVLKTILAPKEHTNIVFSFDWPEEPCWIRVTVDPEQKQEELCLPNNSRWHLTTAHPARIKISQKDQIDKFYDERQINLVGSFCQYDYAQAQFDCFDWMLRNAVYPETSPDGIQSSFYIEVIAVSDEEGDEGDQLYKWAEFYTGGLHVHSENILMAQNSGALHEGGHNLFSLPDLYGYNIKENLIRDETGGLYNTQTVIPEFSLGPVPGGEGYYDSFMNHCHLWLHPANAGKVQYYRNTRPRYFWWGQSRLMATWRNILDLYDVNDQPLTNAAIYVYHGTDGGHKLYDLPKFVGHSDQFGQYIFPDRTDKKWDDPATDEFDGGMPAWTPFAQGYRGTDDRWRQIPFTPNVIETEGILLVKIVANGRTEFFWVTDLDFHSAFFRSGYGPIGRIPIYTSLASPEQPEPLNR